MCKSNPGGCLEWKTKSLEAEDGFYLEGAYTVNQCFHKCKKHPLCGMFMRNKINLAGIPAFSCLLYREGCTLQTSSTYDAYDMKDCRITSNVPILPFYHLWFQSTCCVFTICIIFTYPRHLILQKS